MTGARTVVVFGASSGIGRAVAHQLAERGDRLVLAARAAGPLEETSRECVARGAAVVQTWALDVRDREAVEDLVASTDADAVVVTAGVAAYGRLEDVPAEVFDAVVATNLTGSANVARAVLPSFRAKRAGTLVLTGSVLGQIGAPSMTPYVVSKWAVRALGRQLALENRDLPGVRIAVVSPGGVDTPIYGLAANYQGQSGRPPAPVDSPERVAKAIVRTLDRPRDRVSVGRLNAVMRLGFTLVPWAFDALVGPLFETLATKPDRVAPTTGNVLEPTPQGEALEAGEGQGLRDVVGRL